MRDARLGMPAYSLLALVVTGGEGRWARRRVAQVGPFFVAFSLLLRLNHLLGSLFVPPPPILRCTDMLLVSMRAYCKRDEYLRLSCFYLILAP